MIVTHSLKEFLRARISLTAQNIYQLKFSKFLLIPCNHSYLNSILFTSDLSEIFQNSLNISLPPELLPQLPTLAGIEEILGLSSDEDTSDLLPADIVPTYLLNTPSIYFPLYMNLVIQSDTLYRLGLFTRCTTAFRSASQTTKQTSFSHRY